MIETDKPAEAEPLLAEAADICGGDEPVQPYLAQAQAWRAVCLLAADRPADAAPLLDSGFPVLRTHPAVTKGQAKKVAERVAAEYDRLGKTAEASKWRMEAAR